MSSNSSCLVKPLLKIKKFTASHRVKLESCLIAHFEHKSKAFYTTQKLFSKIDHKVAYDRKRQKTLKNLISTGCYGQIKKNFAIHLRLTTAKPYARKKLTKSQL